MEMRRAVGTESHSYIEDGVRHLTQPHGELRESSDDSSEEADIHVPGLLDSPLAHPEQTMESPYQVIDSQSRMSPMIQMDPASQARGSPMMRMAPPMSLIPRYPPMIPHPQYRQNLMFQGMHVEDSKSFPVFDMRLVHRFSVVQFQKVKVKPGFSTDDLKTSISKQFNAPVDTIHVIEEAGKREGTLTKTIIIILPEKVLEKCFSLIFECYGTVGHMLPQLICARLPVSMKVTEVKKLLAETLKWKTLALCLDSCVLDLDSSLNNFHVKDFDRIQAVNQSIQRVRFSHQPRSDMMSSYYMDVNTCKSVKQVKERIEEYFGVELAKQKNTGNDVLHFCFKGRFLENKRCVGLILSENVHNDAIAIYFAPEDSIYITLQHKSGRQQKQQLMIVSKQTSTAELRSEVSKYLNVDPKAVKLTFEKKFIDEHENLHRVYGEKWKSGIVLAAGIKKRKTIRIKHPINRDEKAFEMYMLEPVSVLTKKVAEEWNLNTLEITLYLRNIRMKNWQPLQFYPIKNNMEITLQLYPRRIEVKVLILKPKTKVTVVINDISESTVEELLRFCAIKFHYARQMSRGIYKDRCLKRNLTLEQEGIKSNDTIVIAYFNHPTKLQGSLINIFMARSDGHTIKRIGSVESGILLHAPKSTSAPSLEDNTEVFDNGPLPAGIYVCDGPCSHSTLQSKTQAKKLPRRSSSKLTIELSLRRKTEFLRRARSMIEPRRRGEHNLVKQSSAPSFYLPETDENTEDGLSGIEISEIKDTDQIEISKAKDTDQKVPAQTSGEFHSESDGKAVNDLDGEISVVNDEMMFEKSDNCRTLYQSPAFSSLLDTHGHNDDRVKILSSELNKEREEECGNERSEATVVKHYHTATSSVNAVAVNSVGVKLGEEGERGETEKDLSAGIVRNDMNETANDSLRTEGSDSDTGYEGNGNGNHSLDLQNTQNQNWQLARFQKTLQPRTHTSSEGSEGCRVMVPTQYTNMTLNRTFPAIQFDDSTNHLHTSGITTGILQRVGRNLGKKWRMLLRTLEMNEAEIDALEYQYGNSGLDELGCQAMVAWKQSKGRAASSDSLVSALEAVGLTSVAEQYCTSGFHTT